MQAVHWLMVAAGGASGALLRTLIYEVYSQPRNAHLFPLPTLTTNLVGSFIIGIGWYVLISVSLCLLCTLAGYSIVRWLL